jgi:hypothetical protein
MRINPINFFDRQLDILPPHFVNMVIEQTHDNHLEQIRSWIYQNCSGRFSITKDIITDSDKTRTVNLVGFEEPGDLTLFALSGVAQKIQN